MANLGRLDDKDGSQLDALIRGLCRAAGRQEPDKVEITHEPARAYGDVFALHELWKDLGFDRALGRALRSGKRRLDVEALVRAMLFNRLCAPDSKLGCLRWLDTVAIPAMPEGVTHQHLLRAMDALMDHADHVESVIGLFKAEVINFLGLWKSAGQVEWETLQWVSWYNADRLHSALGHITPEEAEEAFNESSELIDDAA